MLACAYGCIWFPDCDYINSRSTFHVFWQACKQYLATSKNANLQTNISNFPIVLVQLAIFNYWRWQIWMLPTGLRHTNLENAATVTNAGFIIGICTYIYWTLHIYIHIGICTFVISNFKLSLAKETYTFAVLPTHLQVLPLASLTFCQLDYIIGAGKSCKYCD